MVCGKRYVECVKNVKRTSVAGEKSLVNLRFLVILYPIISKIDML